MNGIEVEFDDVEVAMEDSPAPVIQPSEPSLPPSREPAEPMSFHFAAEIERSFTSLLWQHPEYVALASSELDFTLHITIRPYRKILEAISIVFGDLGPDLDFPCVVQCLLGLDAFEECGGLPGLNQVFTDCDHYPEGRSRPEPFIREYIRLLKEYATARGTDPLQAVRHYTGGRGYLQRNKLATKPAHPTVVGKIQRCCCGKRCVIAGWPGEEGTINLTITPEKAISHGRH